METEPFQAEVAARRAARNNAQNALAAAHEAHVIEPWTDEMQQAVYDEAILGFTDKHILTYSDHLQI